MVYTLVNKNLLIPLVLEADNLDTLLQKLLDQTFAKSNDYNKNVYIVGDEEIYFSKENELYCSKGYNIIKIKIQTLFSCLLKRPREEKWNVDSSGGVSEVWISLFFKSKNFASA